MKINYNLLIKYFIVNVFFQIPFLYKFILFDTAASFFYLGFLLLLPYGIGKNRQLLFGFLLGLFIDLFSNTLGIHAAACVFIMLIRDRWLEKFIGVPEEDINLSIKNFGFIKSVIYLLPLIIFHHIIIFYIEHATFGHSFILIKRILLSSLLTFFCILLFNTPFSNSQRY